MAALAAAYAYEIARYHRIIDASKRVAIVAARTFLLLNGVNIEASQDEKYLTFLQLAQATLTEKQLADWIRKRMSDCTAS